MVRQMREKKMRKQTSEHIKHISNRFCKKINEFNLSYKRKLKFSIVHTDVTGKLYKHNRNTNIAKSNIDTKQWNFNTKKKTIEI